MDKKKDNIKKMLKDIEEMITASKERQGRDVKSEMGSKAMKAKDTAKNFQGGGYSPKTKVDGSKYQGAPISKANLQEYKDAQQKKKEAKPRQRPGAGREAMMAKMEEERKRRQRGESAVVGS